MKDPKGFIERVKSSKVIGHNNNATKSNLFFKPKS